MCICEKKYYFALKKHSNNATTANKRTKDMAIAIKAIPTLYGEDAVRFRQEIEQTDCEFDARPQYDITKDAHYVMMKNILRKAKL